MNLGGVVCEDVYWIHLAQDTVYSWAILNTAMNLQDPHRAIKVFTIKVITSFLRKYPAPCN
jgi:hypothetical protein